MTRSARPCNGKWIGGVHDNTMLFLALGTLLMGFWQSTILSEPLSVDSSVQSMWSGTRISSSLETPNRHHPLNSKNWSLIYVHIGKTGGTTLDSILRSNCDWYSNIAARNLCHGNLNHLETLQSNSEGLTVLSTSTKATLHMEIKPAFETSVLVADAFFVTLRNPIDRFVSAFHMHHPNNTQHWGTRRTLPKNIESLRDFYWECFPTIHDLVASLKNAKSTDKCYSIASELLFGNVQNWKGPSHLHYNYAYYDQLTFRRYPDRPILVARTEDLWEDVKDVDKYLGGTGNFTQAGEAKTWGSENFLVYDYPSTDEVYILCCILADEIEIYERLLRRAVNLSPFKIYKSLSKVHEQCLVAASSSLTTTETEQFSWRNWTLIHESQC